MSKNQKNQKTKIKNSLKKIQKSQKMAFIIVVVFFGTYNNDRRFSF